MSLYLISAGCMATNKSLYQRLPCAYCLLSRTFGLQGTFGHDVRERPHYVILENWIGQPFSRRFYIAGLPYFANIWSDLRRLYNSVLKLFRRLLAIHSPQTQTQGIVLLDLIFSALGKLPIKTR